MRKLLRTIIGLVFAFSIIGGANAADPNILDWPCLSEGWSAGDKWGPGENDIVPSAPPCDFEEPIPSMGIDIMSEVTPEITPEITLPPTDTH